MENYKYHADKTRASGCKSILNPRFVVCIKNAHIPVEVAGFLVDENGKKLGQIDQTWNPPSHEKIRCNHYITKSFEEFKVRCAKGSAATGKNSESKKWSIEKFNAKDMNDIYDDIMDKYINLLKSG